MRNFTVNLEDLMSVWVSKYKQVDKKIHPDKDVFPDFSASVSSGIYYGTINARISKPITYSCQYQMGFLVLDFDEICEFDYGRVFHWQQSAILKFRASDYVKTTLNPKQSASWYSPWESHLAHVDQNSIFALKQRVLSKVEDLAKKQCSNDNLHKLRKCNKVIFMGLARYLNFFYSPVNFYFCYKQNKAEYVLVEVKKTYFTQPNYFLIDLKYGKSLKNKNNIASYADNEKRYKWFITPPEYKASVGVEVAEQDIDFSLWLNIQRVELNQKSLYRYIIQYPFRHLKLALRFCWQTIYLHAKKWYLFK